MELRNLIKSKDNALVKSTAALKQKKFRDETNCFIVEGANLLSQIPDDIYIEYYIIQQGQESGVLRSGVPVHWVTREVFAKVSDTVTPQGVAAVVRKPKPKIAGSNALVLDRVSDAGNIGAIVRSAAAFSFSDIYCINCADAYSPKAVRSSMGGVFFTNIIPAPEGVLDELKGKGFCAVAADMGGVDLQSVSAVAGSRFALVVGSEAHGVSSELLVGCDVVCSIKMENIESLNAGVAASIIMYQLNCIS